MTTPFKRVTKIGDAQRDLVRRGEAVGVGGRTLPGNVLDHVAGRPGLDRRPRGDQDDQNFNPDGSRRDRDERKPRFEVQLLCRTFSGDVGLRPLPPDMAFWESPDIEIVGSSGDPDVATPGEVNKVRVHVWNLGLADCWAAHVDLYWCNPSVGINAAVANAIGAKTVPLAAGQHKVVEFDWTPVVVNDGHECLVAQVYDPVSDPVVAPFNPVQDRHVGQRNVSVVAIAPNQSFAFDLFTQNLAFTRADTLIEVQKLEGDALEMLASAIGRNPWPVAGGDTVTLSPPVLFDAPEPPRELRTGAFRETLQGIPGRSEARRVTAVLRTAAAPRKNGEGPTRETPAEQGMAAYPSPETSEAGADLGELEAVMDEKAGGMRLRLLPGQHARFSLEAALPRGAKRGSADVWRVVEHTAGRITGGVTIVVLAK